MSAHKYGWYRFSFIMFGANFFLHLFLSLFFYSSHFPSLAHFHLFISLFIISYTKCYQVQTQLRCDTMLMSILVFLSHFRLIFYIDYFTYLADNDWYGTFTLLHTQVRDVREDADKSALEHWTRLQNKTESTLHASGRLQIHTEPFQRPWRHQASGSRIAQREEPGCRQEVEREGQHPVCEEQYEVSNGKSMEATSLWSWFFSSGYSMEARSW